MTKLSEDYARLAHEQWAHWMEYMFQKGTIRDDGTWTLPKEFVERWQRQMATPFEELSDAEKDSDRREAQKFMAVLLLHPEIF